MSYSGWGFKYKVFLTGSLKTMTKKLMSVVLACQLLCFPGSGAIAGQLQDFEKAATGKPDQEPNAGEKSSGRGDAFSDALFEALFTGLFEVIGEGVESTMARINPRPDGPYKDIEPRQTGAPDLPFFRFDVANQHINSGVSGWDGRAELGYGALGLQLRQTRYAEKNTEDNLDITYVQGLFRLSGSRYFETCVGLGEIILVGQERNSGTSLVYALNIYPIKELEVRISPAWSTINDHRVSDYDGSIGYVRDYYSVRIGYRRMRAAEDVLAGPYFGAAFYY